MAIKNVVVKEKITEIDFPNIPDFKVKLVYIGREETSKILKACTVYKFNNLTKTREEVVDNDKFAEAFAPRVVKGWSGLKYKNLKKLLAVDLSKVDPEEEIPYSEEDVITLFKESVLFDNVITDALGDIENFNAAEKEKQVKN